MARRHAEIAGAGFAGLAMATALCQRGWTARVHEANAELRAFGAGIFIWENGLRVLRALGAYDAVADGAFAAPAYETRTNGRVLSFQPINGAGQYRLLTMTRQHLYAAMLAAARRAGAEIVTASEAVGATPEGELLLADGRRLRADLVVGADGVRSKVRDSLGIPQQRRKYEDGLIRVLTDRATLKGGDWDHVIDFWHTAGRTLRILYTPCGADQLYMAMMAPVADAEASAVPVRPGPWIECFPQLEPVLTRIGQVARYDVYETTKLAQWSVGRVAIVGDSAHAMPPTLAQGAGCAVTNALGLAVALEEAETAEALRLWEARERPLTDHTQRRAAEIAESRILASGMSWDDEGLRAARHVPTGTGQYSDLAGTA
ncbi:FAD-dependent monooxygenase [Belnapia sp. T6]|uniref:FAD-dependent monooxygenase n=1 Tax=Belnapia mucosa TaxID=2804532 RepID=A0ABS1V6U1_9PROT|nr:NAD(P)/FAD-dependent oxidoreductase [Belnapia mucosa]MBL6457397.1 FAD-dependent monooxygenase [Belnapia mucosa]